MKHYFRKKAAALLLSVLMLSEAANLPVLADEVLDSLRPIPFDDAAISPELEERNLFLIGSRNLTVSETDDARRLIRIVRTGSCEGEAAVTVKFTDLSANYGENYTASVYGEFGNAGKASEQEGRTSIVDFMVENEENRFEEPMLSDEELAALIEKNGGYDLADAGGNIVSSVLIGEDAAEEESEDDALPLSELAAMDELYEPQVFTEAESGLIDDSFPGTELRLTFDAGEREKFIAVKPLYSEKAEGDCLAILSLTNPEGPCAVLEDAFTAVLTVTDEDPHDKPVISLAEAAYTADGDSVSITVTRSGAINETASVHVVTCPDTAQVGIDFSGMDAELVFPMGMTGRTVEIPVQHTAEEETLTFTVRLTTPVNCTLGNEEAEVAVTPAEPSEPMLLAAASEVQSFALTASSSSTDKSNPAYTPYLAAALTPKDFTPFGNAWNTDAYWFKYSCKGVDYDTWNGGTYVFDNPYLYDGIRIRWQAHHDGWLSTSYTYINTDNHHVYYSEENDWDETTEDVIFDYDYNRQLWIGSLTSYFNGIQVDVKKVAPIYRTFDFTLTDADPMSFLGVDEATAKTYTAMQFGDQSELTRTVNASVNDMLTVSAPSSQKETVRLVGLSFLDQDGNELYYQSNTKTARSVTVHLTKSVMSALAQSTVKYDRQSDGRRIGKITVKPVFEYIDAEVTVKPSELGAFTGDFAADGTEKTLSFHLGDRLTLSSVVDSLYDGRYQPDGVRYELRDAEGKLLVNGSGTLDYAADGSLTFPVESPKLVLTPTFRENDNAVRVRVKKSDVKNGVFTEDSAVFLMARSRAEDGDWYVYTVTGNAVHLDQLVVLSANPADPRYTAQWSIPGAAHDFSGSAFYFTAARDAADNVITLTAAPAEEYAFSGSVFHADRNLATGVASASPVIPAEGALISADCLSVGASEDGSFVLNGVKGADGTCERLLIWADNRFTLRDVYLNPVENDYNLGVVTAASNTPDGAYFTGVIFRQNGALVTSTETLLLNGGSLTMTATVQDGNRYSLGGETYTERVTGVTFHVLDGLTHRIKSSYAASESSDGAWTAVIGSFSPEAEESYTYGDCFYVSMTTDRIRAAVPDENGEIPEQFRCTDYAMLSTGYEILRDADYQPQTFTMNLPVSAAQVLGGSNTKREFVTLPFIGSLDFFAGVRGSLKSPVTMYDEDAEPADAADYFDEDDPDHEPEAGPETSQGSGFGHTQFRITFTTEKLPYGGTRLKFGVTASRGNAAFRNSSAANPWDTKAYIFSKPTKHGVSMSDAKDNDVLTYNDPAGTAADKFKASLGTPRMVFSVYFGLYVDFALLQTVDLDTGATGELDFELMGGGGFFSGNVQVEWQWMAMAGPIPVYWGVVGSAGGGGTLGVTRNAEEVLRYSDFVNGSAFDADQLDVDVSLFANASVKGYGGVGIPDLLGARLILGLNASYVYEPSVNEMYPAVTNDYGISLELTLGGQLDLFVTRIPVEAFSWPFYTQGFTEYFVLLKRANKLVNYTLQELDAKGGSYSDAFVSGIRDKVDVLSQEIKNGVSQNALQNAFDSLLAAVYSDDVRVITTLEYASIFYLASPMDVFFTDYDAKSAGEDEQTEDPAVGTPEENLSAGADAVFEGETERIEHTDSVWVANRPALTGSFGNANSKVLVRDNYTQSSVQMAELGGGRVLAVFLTDTSEEGETVNPTLVMTVLDTESGKWSEPAVIQNDGTPDYTPNLCDAGDRVLLTWASTDKTPDEYENDGELLRDLDIYAAFLDKETLSADAPVRLTDEPVRLTDDGYMDSRPAAAYSSADGSIIVYYVKNDEEVSDSAASYLTAESLLTYRLYDGQSQNWVSDYYEEELPDYTEEEREEIGKLYHGERFLSSSVKNDDPDKPNLDLPIAELSVCEGYNDLAVFAYTVDMDGDPSTAEDRDLFVRVYQFSTHRTFQPIRITDDGVSQAMPQLIRNTVPYIDCYDCGEGEEGVEVGGTTYLFWLDDVNQVKYISVTDLVRNGIDKKGTLKADYTLDPVTVNTSLPNGELSSVSSYQALTDEKDNLYLIWSQTVADAVTPENTAEPAAMELFAAAKIHASPDRSETVNGMTSTLGSSWSAPVQLTHSGVCNDSLRGVVSEDGRLWLTHNRWTVDYVGDDPDYLEANPLREDGTRPGNPYEIGSTNLMATEFAPIGSVEVTNFRFSDTSPMAGDAVTVTAVIENTGLTTAKGYTVSFYESKNGVRGRKLAEAQSNEWLTANASRAFDFEWTVPADFDGMQIVAAAEESGYAGETVSVSDPLTAQTAYSIHVDSLKQTGDAFTAQFTVANTGNAPADGGEKTEIRFSGLYGRYDTFYGLETDLLAEIPLEGLDAKEEKTYTVTFAVPESAFDCCGYDEAAFTVTDADGRTLSDAVQKFLILEEPMNVRFPQEEISLNAGDTADGSLTVDSRFLGARAKALYSSSDTGVFTVDEAGNITAVGEGTALLTAIIQPFGTEVTLPVTVTGAIPIPEPKPTPAPSPIPLPLPKSQPKPVPDAPAQPDETAKPELPILPTVFGDVFETDYFFDAVRWAVEEGITTGVSENVFLPLGDCTRAQTVTFLWRAAGCPEPMGSANFADVPAESWYAKAVCWAAETGVTKGTSENRFSPDRKVTRAEAVTFLYRCAAAIGEDVSTDGTGNPFKDVAESDYYYDAVLWAVSCGITKGTSETAFSPSAVCTRAQIVTFFYRMTVR